MLGTEKPFFIQIGQTSPGIWDEHLMNNVPILEFYKQKTGLELIQLILELDGEPLLERTASVELTCGPGSLWGGQEGVHWDSCG